MTAAQLSQLCEEAGRIYGALGFNAILSATDRNRVEDWLARRVGVTF